MGQWRPWRELRERNDVHYELAELPARCRAIVARSGLDTVILINQCLDPAERLTALAHELVHIERGGGCHRPGIPDRLRPLVAREENRVDEIVARRLVPAHELAAFVAERTTVGPVTAFDVASEFGVSLEVALRACKELRRAG
jgi:Zn-dependent peptidase ImmA (M78 family)